MSEIERVYFVEAVYVGTENFPSLPPVADMTPERRGLGLWRFAADGVGVTVTWEHQASGGSAFVPWANVKSVSYKRVQNAPATSTKGAK